MFKEHTKHLACPYCNMDLVLSINEETDGQIKSGELSCTKCKKVFPIINFIPRFVSSDNYADNFGFEWNIFSNVWYDEYLGLATSKERFFSETKWCEKSGGGGIKNYPTNSY